MPKAELHAHFSGSIPRSAYQAIIDERGLSPELLPPVFSHPVDGIQAYLRPWLLYRQLPTDAAALRAYARAVATEFRADRVVYAELRHTVLEIANANSLSLSNALSSLLDAIEDASTGDIDIRLIVGVSRWRATEDYLA